MGNDELFNEICERMANGETLMKICRDDHMPNRATVQRWIMNDDGKRRQYEAARRACVEFWSDQIIDIATDGSKDTITDRKGRARCDWEWLGRSKLRVETMFKLMRVIDPARYGDKLPEATEARRIEMEQQQAIANAPPLRFERVIIEPGGGGNENLQQRIAELEAQLADRNHPGIGHNGAPEGQRMDKDIAERIVRLVKDYIRRDDRRAPETVLDEVLHVCRDALLAFYGPLEAPATA